MPAGGQNRKPTKIKELLGTANSTRVLKDEFVPTIMIHVPEPPDHYSDKVKKTWYKIATELLDAGILYNIDVDLLERYCDLTDLQQGYYLDIKKHGRIIENDKGNIIANPASTQITAIEGKLQQLGAVLGLGASNRTRIGGMKPKEKNTLRELLSKKPT